MEKRDLGIISNYIRSVGTLLIKYYKVMENELHLKETKEIEEAIINNELKFTIKNGKIELEFGKPGEDIYYKNIISLNDNPFNI